MLNFEHLKSVLNGIDIFPTDEQLGKLSDYFDMVVDKNKQFNLPIRTEAGFEDWLHLAMLRPIVPTIVAREIGRAHV